MAHFHEDSDTYYLDQLCLIALSAAFGGVCLALYFWNTAMLKNLLIPDFWPYIGISGFVLLGLAIIRATVLWRAVGQSAARKQALAHAHAHDHAHNHDHAHSHDHAHAGAEHVRFHGPDCTHGHGDTGPHHHEHGTHPHDHGHADHGHADHGHADHGHADHGHADHGHADHDHADHDHADHDHADHDHADHDHGWAPWRYVVLLLPVFLFLLGLPNEPPGARASVVDVDHTEMAAGFTTLIALAPDPLQDLFPTVCLYNVGPTGSVRSANIKQLLDAPVSNPSWAGQWVRARGQFVPYDDHRFNIARFRMFCCGGDAIQLNVGVISRDKLRDGNGNWVVAGNTVVRQKDWVEVTGRVHFLKRGPTTIPVLEVISLRHIAAVSPDLDPYLY